MGRTPAYCKQCRREGEKLFLKGERCFTKKCSVERRDYPPGAAGASKRKRQTEFGLRLREKQKARRIYGLNERQFRGYFEKASRKVGVTGEKLLESLECRLDNVAFRLGFAASRSSGRQLVRHGHIKVNGKSVNIPSYATKVNDLISADQKTLNKVKERLKDYTPPSWLSLDGEFNGKIIRLPDREDTEKLIEEALIVEYYSR